MLIALCLVVLIAGCSAGSKAQPQGVSSTTQAASSESGSAAAEAQSQPETAPGGGSGEILPQSPLQLIIDSPKDGDTVNSTTVTIQGRTAPDAVVSVNDTIAIADQTGRFTLNPVLDPGLQVIEVEASNTTGEDIIVSLSVDVQP